MIFKLTIFIIFIFHSLVFGEKNDEFAHFVDDLNTIATKTKQNIDYMPSTVTVLHSKDLTSLGVNTLFEALSFVPGIETSMLQVGWKRLIARGMNNPDSFIFDKMKLLIDGVSVSSKFYGTIYYYMDFPVDLIERIEVLRGAASALYGDGAYNGAINVITKSVSSQDTLLNISYGSYDYRSTSALVPVSFAGFNGSIDAYFQENNQRLGVSKEFIYAPSISIFKRKPESDERLKNGGAGVNVKSENFDFIARYNYYKSGNYFGFDEALEPTIDDKFNDNINFHTQLAYRKKIDSDITLHVKTVFSTSKVSFDITPRQEVPNVLPFDIELESGYKDRTILINSELEINKFENHTLLFGLEADNTKVTENYYRRNFDFLDGNTENATFIDNGNIVTSNSGFIKSDAGREHFASYLQDLYSFSDILMFSLNIRYDHYKRFSSNWNSRVGLVYDYNDKLTLKLQYAEAFRVASFIEAYQAFHALLREGNNNLDNEKQNSYEASFIYKESSHQVLRGNLYYSKFYNTIDINDVGEKDYDNADRRESKGIEVEYKIMPYESHELSLSYSYTDSTYNTMGRTYSYKVDTPGIASHLFKAYHLFKVSRDFSLNSTVSYIGSRDDNEYSNVQKYDIKSSWITNISSSYLLNKNAKFRLTINNLFDTKVTLPSYRSRHKYLPRPGRTILASLHFTF